MYLYLSLRARDCVASVRRGLPFGRRMHLLTCTTASCSVCDEYSYVSAWSITHFLSGYWWSLVWTYSFNDFLPWLNLLLFAVAATVFELLENQPMSGKWMWGWLGYDENTYTGDSVTNSVTDVLISLVGWAVVRSVVTYTTSTLALGIMLGVSGVLFVIFLLLYRMERQRTFARMATDEGSEPERPTLVLKP